MSPENDKLEHLDEVTITIIWPDGSTAETTVAPEEAWDILHRGKGFTPDRYELAGEED
jgi:hypothetical protein